jgi:hypothetical protein
MNTRQLVLTGAVATIGVLALGSIGFAVAQTGDTPPGPGVHGTTAGHEQKDNHGGMTGHESMGGTSGMAGHGAEQQAQMHEAAAKALGITVAELDAQLKSGKTIADIAKEKGLDLATLRGAMQGAHPSGHGAGMGTNEMAPSGQQHS